MDGNSKEAQRNPVLHKVVQALHYTERAWNPDVSDYAHGRGQIGTPMRLSGRPQTWADIRWQQDTHTAVLAFKVRRPCLP